jgi:hypothetical protein
VHEVMRKESFDTIMVARLGQSGSSPGRSYGGDDNDDDDDDDDEGISSASLVFAVPRVPRRSRMLSYMFHSASCLYHRYHLFLLFNSPSLLSFFYSPPEELRLPGDEDEWRRRHLMAQVATLMPGGPSGASAGGKSRAARGVSGAGRPERRRRCRAALAVPTYSLLASAPPH